MKSSPEVTISTVKSYYDATTSQSGFTLLEAIIAMTIFVIGTLAVLAMQYGVVRNNTSGDVMTQATYLAQVKMEELKNSQDVTMIPTATCAATVNGIFTTSCTVNNPVAGGSRLFTVTVTWARGSRGAGTRQVQLISLSQGGGV